jgi:hypothetical protein
VRKKEPTVSAADSKNIVVEKVVYHLVIWLAIQKYPRTAGFEGKKGISKTRLTSSRYACNIK